MTSVLAVRHGQSIPIGHFGEAAMRAGVAVDEVMLSDGERRPPASEYDGIAVFGGSMGAYDTESHPWLRGEKVWLRTAVEAGIPVLGICLGCQLLADALGGSASLAEGGPEIGYFLPVRTTSGLDDPVLRHLDRPVPVWHQDTWELPPGGMLLAASDRHPHAFRLGSAVGIQSHPEADADVVAGWIASEGTAHFEHAGVDPDAFISSIVAAGDEQREMAVRLFGAWLDGLGT